MKKLLLVLTILSSVSAFAVELSKKDLAKYATAVENSKTSEGQVKACQDLSFALKSIQAEELSEQARLRPENVRDNLCQTPDVLSDSDILKFSRLVEDDPTTENCRKLDFALQFDYPTSNLSKKVIVGVEKVLHLLCE